MNGPVALTGATGFVGGHVLAGLEARGRDIRALTRRAMPSRDRVTWVDGDLADTDALGRLVDGCDSVIHVAGVLNAPDRAAFDDGNIAGTGRMIEAAQAAGVKRFVHVSSLAAREPQLSMYGASKAESEAIVRAASLPFAIVRPPAVYGPGDRETLDLFRMAKHRFVLLPPAGKLSLIHVDDLARLLVALADDDAADGLLIEPDDAHPGGWTHAEFARMLGAAVGRAALPVHAPKSLLSFGAKIDRLARGTKARLTPDRVAYFCHPDWVVDATHAAPAALWTPQIATPDGLAATARWYKAQNWL